MKIDFYMTFKQSAFISIRLDAHCNTVEADDQVIIIDMSSQGKYVQY